VKADLRATIQELMVRLHDGDRTAFPPLADALWPVVLAFAQSAGGPGVEPDDIAQEVFLRLCTRMAEFDPRRDAVSWIYGIARYEVMTHRKRRQRRREVDEPALAFVADPAGSAEDRLVHQDLVVRLTGLVGQLTEADKLALGLDEAGGTAGGATARKRKQRALDRLRELWRSLHG
jgi:RNA polymerase sigma factor (sigma-70 family)